MKDVYFSRNNEVNPYDIGDEVRLRHDLEQHGQTLSKGTCGKIVDVVHDAHHSVILNRWTEASYEAELRSEDGTNLGCWTVRPSDLELLE